MPSQDVLDLNPHLTARDKREMNGREDCADLLLDQLTTHAPDLARRFVREYRVGPWRIDLALAELRLAVEVNGGYANARGGKHGSDRDHQKIRQLTRAGWHVYQFTANEVRSAPMDVIDELRLIVEK